MTSHSFDCRVTAKLFFTAAQLFDSLAVFGDLTDEVTQKSRYAKWRAAYIVKCIKSGDKPLPPDAEEDENQPESNANEDQDFGTTGFFSDVPPPLPSVQPRSSSSANSSTNSNFASLSIHSSTISGQPDPLTASNSAVLKALSKKQGIS